MTVTFINHPTKRHALQAVEEWARLNPEAVIESVDVRRGWNGWTARIVVKADE